MLPRVVIRHPRSWVFLRLTSDEIPELQPAHKILSPISTTLKGILPIVDRGRIRANTSKLIHHDAWLVDIADI